jgi:hypothetical protein
MGVELAFAYATLRRGNKNAADRITKARGLTEIPFAARFVGREPILGGWYPIRLDIPNDRPGIRLLR